MQPTPQRTTTDAPSTAALLEHERVEAERRMNAVRGMVLAVLVGAAVMYAPKLTPALTLVNVSVLTPMLVWTLWQQIFIHRRRAARPWLTTTNAVIDITAVTALLYGYGWVGLPELAVKSPIWVAYFVVLAARPFTSSARSAAIALAFAVVEYAAIVVGFTTLGGLSMGQSPLTVAVTGERPWWTRSRRSSSSRLPAELRRTPPPGTSERSREHCRRSGRVRSSYGPSWARCPT